jgi:uncharacterized protein RhaS with RHS repeats
MTTRTLPPAPAALLHEYLIEEDEMGDSTAQSRLMDYLTAVLRWLYREDGWFVARNLTVYHPAIRNSQRMISPDIAVFTGIALTPQEQETLTSWDMRPAREARSRRGDGEGTTRPCPPVLFEIGSSSTWQTDIAPGPAAKPHIYGTLGARAYFAYDPNRPPVWRPRGSGRLLGWRYDAHGQPVALTPDARGWLWSADLDSWLAPEGALLRLYDAQGRVRLTEAAAREEQAQSERRARQQAEEQAQSERRARQQAEAQAEAGEVARRHLEERLSALQEILKAHHIDPDRL